MLKRILVVAGLALAAAYGLHRYAVRLELEADTALQQAWEDAEGADYCDPHVAVFGRGYK